MKNELLILELNEDSYSKTVTENTTIVEFKNIKDDKFYFNDFEFYNKIYIEKNEDFIKFINTDSGTTMFTMDIKNKLLSKGEYIYITTNENDELSISVKNLPLRFRDMKYPYYTLDIKSEYMSTNDYEYESYNILELNIFLSEDQLEGITAYRESFTSVESLFKKYLKIVDKFSSDAIVSSFVKYVTMLITEGYLIYDGNVYIKGTTTSPNNINYQLGVALDFTNRLRFEPTELNLLNLILDHESVLDFISLDMDIHIIYDNVVYYKGDIINDCPIAVDFNNSEMKHFLVIDKLIENELVLNKTADIESLIEPLLNDFVQARNTLLSLIGDNSYIYIYNGGYYLADTETIDTIYKDRLEEIKR